MPSTPLSTAVTNGGSAPFLAGAGSSQLPGTVAMRGPKATAAEVAVREEDW